MDIGKVESPKDSSGKAADRNVLRTSDLTLFVNKVEDVVDTELETLRNYILKNTSERSQTLDLAQFYDHVYQWAVTVWRDRTGIIPEEDFASPPVTSPSSTQGPRAKSLNGKSQKLTDK